MKKIILKPAHLEKLKDIMEQSLSAHRRAKWENIEARKTIIKLIIKKFMDYLEI